MAGAVAHPTQRTLAVWISGGTTAIPECGLCSTHNNDCESVKTIRSKMNQMKSFTSSNPLIPPKRTNFLGPNHDTLSSSVIEENW